MIWASRPWSFGERYVAEAHLGGRIICDMNSVEINLTAKDQQVGEPWLWRLSREFDVRVTVQKANVDSDYGWVQIRLDGPLEEIQRATAWLMTTGLHVDALQRSVGA